MAEELKRYIVTDQALELGVLHGKEHFTTRVYRCSDVDPILARARDVALLARAMLHADGVSAWVVENGDLLRVHIGANLYECDLDETGLPVLTPELREALEACL